MKSLKSNSTLVKKIVFTLLLSLCLFPFVGPPVALLLGILAANTIGHPFDNINHKATNILLKSSVVGLGFGMDVNTALTAGKEGLLFTVVSIFTTLILGYFIGKWLGINRKISFLISGGTAICGGSAIAAIAPVIKSEEKETSIALGTIFILNSAALFIFPMVGHTLGLTEKEFGLWCAIAIHDTSSVVGAASKFGPIALQVATTVKLARALWIIPVAIGTAFLFKNKSGKIKIPYFIGLFVLVMLLNTYSTNLKIAAPYFVEVAKTGLTLTLFLIGAGLHRNILRTVGLKPLVQGIILWTAISITSLYFILQLS